MTRTSPTRSTAGHAAPRSAHEADSRVARRSRRASGALVLVLLAVSTFAIWSSQATSHATAQAVTAIGLSDDYAEAANAVGGEESLERKYRLEPGPEVQARYDTVADRFVAALGEVRRDGDAADRAFVDATLGRHDDYLQAIDRLLMTMTEDCSNSLIVHSVVDLGHNLGLTIVAEGVESEQALCALREFGCDVAQGYHLSRPVPAADLDCWLLGRVITPAHRVGPARTLVAATVLPAVPASSTPAPRVPTPPVPAPRGR